MRRYVFQKGVLVVVAAFAALAFGLAPGAQVSWSNLYTGSADEAFYGAAPTSDGGYVAWGWTRSSGAGDFDAWLVRLGPSGDVVWQRTYGGPLDDTLSGVLLLDDGGFLALADTNSFGQGGYDAWVLRLDASGNVLWQRTYGGPGDEWAGLGTPAGDGGFILSGYTDSSGAGQQDVWVLKIGADGHIVWQKTIGGTGQEWPYSMLPVQDGFLIAAASYASGGHESGLLIKLDGSGNVLWERLYANSALSLYFNGITPFATGGFLLWGPTSEGGGGDNLWMARLDDTGAILWQKALGTPYTDCMDDAFATPDGGCVLAGYNYPYPSEPGNADMWAIKVDGSGNLLWQRNYGQSGWDIADGASLANDGGLLLSGRMTSGGAYHAWLLKTAADGTTDSSCTFAGPSTATLGAASAIMSDLTLAPLAGTAVEGAVSAPGAAATVGTQYLCASAGTCTVACTVTAPASLALGDQAAFSAKAAPQHCAGLATFTWDFGDGGTSTLPNPVHSYATNGQYTWTLTATSDGVSCTKTGSVTVTSPPVITAMTKAGNPFRIIVKGSNLQSGIKVYIGGAAWTNVVRPGDSALKIKGGASLKAAVPKGVSKEFRFVNSDGGETVLTWHW